VPSVDRREGASLQTDFFPLAQVDFYFFLSATHQTRSFFGGERSPQIKLNRYLILWSYWQKKFRGCSVEMSTLLDVAAVALHVEIEHAFLPIWV